MIESLWRIDIGYLHDFRCISTRHWDCLEVSSPYDFIIRFITVNYRLSKLIPWTIITRFFHLIIGHFQNFHFLNISWTESHYTMKGYFGKVLFETRSITVTPYGNMINIFVLQYIFWRIAYESNFWKITKSLRMRKSA